MVGSAHPMGKFVQDDPNLLQNQQSGTDGFRPTFALQFRTDFLKFRLTSPLTSSHPCGQIPVEWVLQGVMATSNT
jgi:hypothetical protein